MQFISDPAEHYNIFKQMMVLHIATVLPHAQNGIVEILLIMIDFSMPSSHPSYSQILYIKDMRGNLRKSSLLLIL